MENKANNKKLREGFTTGSSATAGIVAGLYALFKGKTPSFINITAPAGILNIPIESYFFSDNYAKTVVVKDGGDDPDCTHNIKIVSEIYINEKPENIKNLVPLKISPLFDFYTGEGVGVVTKKGLPVEIGEPAINPIPRKMIKENVENFLNRENFKIRPTLILSVPDGIEIAKKTLNERLGIIGGISILGTTGVVKPISMSAFTSSIDLALNIAKEKNINEIVLSFGRQSEESAMKILNLAEESFVMMGDHFDYALRKARQIGFKKIIISCQFGKLLKALLGYKNTNVKYGEFKIEEVINFLNKKKINPEDIKRLVLANTARHLLEIIENFQLKEILNLLVEEFSQKYKVNVLLFSYDGRLLARH